MLNRNSFYNIFLPLDQGLDCMILWRVDHPILIKQPHLWLFYYIIIFNFQVSDNHGSKSQTNCSSSRFLWYHRFKDHPCHLGFAWINKLNISPKSTPCPSLLSLHKWLLKKPSLLCTKENTM